MFYVCLGIISVIVVLATFFSIINRWLYRLNKRYDHVQEPARLLIMMALVLPGISTGGWSRFLPGYWELWGMFFGFAWMATLLLIRMAYIHGVLKEN